VADRRESVTRVREHLGEDPAQPATTTGPNDGSRSPPTIISRAGVDIHRRLGEYIRLDSLVGRRLEYPFRGGSHVIAGCHPEGDACALGPLALVGDCR